MMSNVEIRQAIKELEGQKPKNGEEFDIREAELNRLRDLFLSKVVF